jgi:hypothetical protein
VAARASISFGFFSQNIDELKIFRKISIEKIAMYKFSYRKPRRGLAHVSDFCMENPPEL